MSIMNFSHTHTHTCHWHTMPAKAELHFGILCNYEQLQMQRFGQTINNNIITQRQKSAVTELTLQCVCVICVFGLVGSSICCWFDQTDSSSAVSPGGASSRQGLWFLDVPSRSRSGGLLWGHPGQRIQTTLVASTGGPEFIYWRNKHAQKISMPFSPPHSLSPDKRP